MDKWILSELKPDRKIRFDWLSPEIEKDAYYIGYGKWLNFLEFFWRIKCIVFPLLVIFEMFERKSVHFDKFIERLGGNNG